MYDMSYFSGIHCILTTGSPDIFSTAYSTFDMAVSACFKNLLVVIQLSVNFSVKSANDKPNKNQMTSLDQLEKKRDYSYNNVMTY